MRKIQGEELVIATHNQGKAAEIKDLLAPYISNFLTATDLDLEEPEETGSTFAENAILKARAAALASGKIALADDSGLSVKALGGDPGIYSARWAGPDKDFAVAMGKINDLLEDKDNRNAAFICVLALVWPDGQTQIFEGRVEGQIIWPPRGEKGFGYDPFFVPDGYDLTFAEMEPAEKHKISHRAHAFELLMKSCMDDAA